MVRYTLTTAGLQLNLIMVVMAATLLLVGCEGEATDPQGEENSYVELLTQQVDANIIPAAETYVKELEELRAAVEAIALQPSNELLGDLHGAYTAAYLDYQRLAVHNYFATVNQGLVTTTNLYPVDTVLLAELIAERAYAFNTTAQMRANGFPALDYLLFGGAALEEWAAGTPTHDYVSALLTAMLDKAVAIRDNWSGSLRENFINNGGTSLGSSISVQLNESVIYLEDHVRENKVGIPIGRLGPLDSPIEADSTKIEAYYACQFFGTGRFALDLVRSSIQECERMYIVGSAATKDSGYYGLLVEQGHQDVADDILAQYALILDEIDGRTSIMTDDRLYIAVQDLVTLYKTDLFPLLNVQDADGANDGD